MHIDTSSFALKLAPIPVDLSKLSNVVKNDVFKKTEHNAEIKNIEDETPDITNLLKLLKLPKLFLIQK